MQDVWMLRGAVQFKVNQTRDARLWIVSKEAHTEFTHSNRSRRRSIGFDELRFNHDVVVCARTDYGKRRTCAGGSDRGGICRELIQYRRQGPQGFPLPTKVASNCGSALSIQPARKSTRPRGCSSRPRQRKRTRAHTRNEHLRREKEALFDVLRAAQNQNTRPSSSFLLWLLAVCDVCAAVWAKVSTPVHQHQFAAETLKLVHITNTRRKASRAALHEYTVWNTFLLPRRLTWMCRGH